MGDEGAEHVSAALTVNQVRGNHVPSVDILCGQSLKTLTTLDLGWNEISVLGAEHLAAALKSNRVRMRHTVFRRCSTVTIIAGTGYTEYREEPDRCSWSTACR